MKQLVPDECCLFSLSGVETVYVTTSTYTTAILDKKGSVLVVL